MIQDANTLSVWREQLWSTYVRLESRSDAHDFYGRVVEFIPETHSLSLVDSTSQLTERTRHHVRTDHQEVVLVAFQLAGQGVVAQDDRESRTVPGQFVFYESGRPYSLSFDGPFKQLVLRVHRDKLLSRLPGLGNLTARAFEARHGCGAVALDFLRSLAARGPSIRDAQLALVERVASDLVAGSVVSLITDVSPRRAVFERLRGRIIEEVRDPSFDPLELATIAGMSSRSLRRLCAENGTSPGQLILQTRLQGVKDDLSTGTNAKRAVSDIALSWGFNDLSHFNHSFKAAYGIPPSRMRTSN
ncbi:MULTISPECIES: AraC-like ligand-binding domain-containing protein [Rhizobium/Agrobacterium group]|uniref:AraC family transcriptional regulator n=1 Tax=Rhizobium nepotum 39/7 TaxID=1368418 RepID=A0ABR5CKY0_9HYPH|nr:MULTISPECIES: helix-turn-helix domain-containing protein [Rhizobium/Agrobacterium group]KJF65477.1 AraC family transcriptional regulator [Rhizobium nepotum 39/7]NTA83867.1 helix-turn-helix domain-containing protein [Agrobacterium tumefaciens]